VEWLKVAANIRDLNRPEVFEHAKRLLKTMAQAFADSDRVRDGVDFLRKQMLRESTGQEMSKWLCQLIEDLSNVRVWEVTFHPEARARSTVLLLDAQQFRIIGAECVITGAMAFPGDWWNSVTLEAENLVILRRETRLPSPRIAKRHPDLPEAARARFKIAVRLEDADRATIHARGSDGSRMTVICFARLSGIAS
jgi:hypothetical protein